MFETGHLPHSGVKYGGLLFAAEDALGDQEVAWSQASAIGLIHRRFHALEKERSRSELLYWIAAGCCWVTIDQRVLAVVTLGEIEPEVLFEKVM